MLLVCFWRINYVYIHKQKSCYNQRLYILFQTFVEVAAWKNIISKNRAGRILKHTTHVTIGAFQQTPSASYNRSECTTVRYKIRVTNISFTDTDSNVVLWYSLQQFKCLCFQWPLCGTAECRPAKMRWNWNSLTLKLCLKYWSKIIKYCNGIFRWFLPVVCDVHKWGVKIHKPNTTSIMDIYFI
jgi:hypothetical protein